MTVKKKNKPKSVAPRKKPNGYAGPNVKAKDVKPPSQGLQETRVVNEKTGGEKGSKEIAWHLVPWEPMQEVAKLYHHGSKKYAPNNWALGYDWSLSYSAGMRHFTDFWMGESYHEVIPGEPETACHHLASVIFHCLALMYFEKHHPDLDDRQLRLFDEG